jgi:type I restriction enzyme S subunit
VKNVSFGELFTSIRNGLSIKQDKSGDGLPITRIETISAGIVDPGRVGYAGLRVDEAKNWLLREGDILFSHINSVEHIGKCAVYRSKPMPLVHGMNLLCLRPDPQRLDPAYGHWLIRSTAFRSRLSSFINKAVNQASVSISNLRTIRVAVPVLEEQQRIAAILDQAEALRGKRHLALARLDTLTESVFLEMFGDPLQGPGTHTIALCDLVVGMRNGTSAEQGENEGGWPITRIETISDGTIDLSRVGWIKPDDDLLERFRLQSGDILFSHINSPAHIGKTALYAGEPTMLIHGINLMRLRPSQERVVPAWLLQALKMPSIRSYYRSRCKKAVNQASLNTEDIGRLRFNVPPLAMQHEFASATRKVAKVVQEATRSRQSMVVLFQALQQRAFMGTL